MKQSNLLDIQTIANEACFQTNYQIKSNAENQFYHLCLKLSKNQLEQLINGYSQTVLFVTIEYIYKIVPMLNDPREYFVTINDAVERWYNTNANATLIRDDKLPLQQYIENSMGRTIGQLLKFMYLKKQLMQWLTNFIKQRANSRYRLYLWKQFISAISYVDNELSFLVYRMMVYNFQESVIPIIMDSLLPYFHSVQQEIEINDLAFMQSNLSVAQNGIQKNSQVNLFNSREVKFTELVFQVLNEVICFNYNITYSQFESQTPIKNYCVSFPDLVTQKVINKQFLVAIFYVAQKLINDTNYSEQKQNINNIIFLKITLECIQKIMLVKLSFVSQFKKKQFIQIVIISMTRLLNSNKLNQQSILSLIQSNLKFLINVQLYQIRTLNQQYLVWLNKIKDTIVNIISKSVIHIQNQLVLASIQLTTKIIQQSVSPKLKDQAAMFKAFGMEIVSLLIDKIFTQDCNLLGIGKIKNYEQSKRMLTNYLKKVRQICCINLQFIFQKLQPMIQKVLRGQNINAISNIYLFLSQFWDRTILHHNILYETISHKDYTQLGKLICMCLQWITIYRSYPPIQNIQIAILIFIEKLLLQALQNLFYQQNELKIRQGLYKIIQQNKQSSLTTQQFLIFCFNQITRNLINSDFQKANYTFQVLNPLLIKFKLAIKREYFKQSPITKNVLSLCKQLSQSNFDGEMLTLRKQLFKIITNILFDDILDDYRTNINDLVQSLEKTLAENRWKAMYDLTGICQAIDTSVIYRYFMITLQKSKISIQVIMNDLFSHVDEASCNNNKTRIELIKSILKLQLSMIDNKGQRLQGPKNIFYNYKIINNLMPYWTILLQQQECKIQDWDQIILQLYKIVNTLIKNNNTNFFILQKNVNCYADYIKYLLLNMVNISKWVQSYPTLFIQYCTAMDMISRQLMQIIFCNKNEQIVRTFNKLLSIFMQITIKNIEQINKGNRSNEQKIFIYFDIIKNIFKYLRNAKKFKHKIQQINNINLLNQDIQIKYQYVIVLFKFGIDSWKKIPKILLQICFIIHNMDFLAQAAMPIITQKLGLQQNMKQQLLQIWKEKVKNQVSYICQIKPGQDFLQTMAEWFKKFNEQVNSME